MGSELHPIVAEVASLLESQKTELQPPLFLKEEHHDAVTAALAALAKDMEDFKKAVRDLFTFSNYLAEQKKSPQAADAIIHILGNHPEVARMASEATQEDGTAHREKIGDQFSKFVGAQSAAETQIPPSEPSVSVKDLLRKMKK